MPFDLGFEGISTVAEPVGATSHISGQVDIESVENPYLDRQVVVDAETVDLVASGSGGVGDDVGVAPVDLGVARAAARRITNPGMYASGTPRWRANASASCATELG